MKSSVRQVVLRRQRYADYAFAFDPLNGWYKGSDGIVRQDPTLLPGYSYTRSGAKSELNASGVPVPFAANVPGVVTGVGYWSRGGLTNLVPNSNQSSQSGQSGGQPDLAGQTGAVLYTTNDGDQAVTVATATTYTASRFCKRFDNDWVRLVVFETANGANQIRLWVNLATGAVGSTSVVGNGLITIVGTPAVTACANGYYRLSMSFQSASATGVSVGIRRAASDGSTTVTGTGYYGYNLQDVPGAQPGPIIVTTGSAAAVGADNLNLTSPITADEDFVLVAVVNSDHATGSDERLAGISDGTAANRLVLVRGNTGAINSFAFAAGISVFTSNAGSQLLAGRTVIAQRRRGGKYSTASKDGTGVVTVGVESAAAAFPTGLSRLDIGQLQGGSPVNSPMQFVGIKRGTFSDADLTAILQAA